MRGGVWDSNNAFVDFILSLLLLTLFYGICAFLIRIEREKNNVSIDLERQRQKIPYGVPYRRTDGRVESAGPAGGVSAVGRPGGGLPVFLAMMDLDDFKRLNDTYGHYRGDDYLKALGGVLKAVETDRIQAFRFGGDEFCMLFYTCSREEAEQVCCEIQTRFAEESVHKTCRPVSDQHRYRAF